ncbi:MAG TPA: peptide chain release factor N(5)-glutamine methyltransferase [Acidimicrobiia bacterium]|nr:peptide chain release factor N(5)-glutamine methyltransferase [Acidimicrobiia bacterium]
MASWRQLLDDATRALDAAGVTAASTEARWMLEEVSGYDAAELLANRGDDAPARAVARLQGMVARRAAGEPLQYVLGHWSFRDLDLLVDPRVLIPRPETEVVAEVALDEAVRLGARRGRPRTFTRSHTPRPFTIADLGTGSGALALALATQLPEAEVWATDVSEDALAVARANLAGIGTAATRVRVASGSWFDALPPFLRGHVRLVVSNPPYVANREMQSLPADVADHEPMEALVSGPTGLEAIERILADAPSWLVANGSVVCEIAPHQSVDAVAVALEHGFEEAFTRPDLAGRERVLVARRRIGWPGWPTSSTSTRCSSGSGTGPRP